MDRLRIARGVFAVLAALSLVGILAYSVALLAAPTTDAGREYAYARAGDDYVLYTVPQIPNDHNAYARWTVSVGNLSPDRIIIVHAQDLPDVLAGREPPHGSRVLTRGNATDWGFYAGPVKGELRLEQLRSPGPLGRLERPYACPACIDDPRPAFVFARGSGWIGANASSLSHGHWDIDASGRASADAPILVTMISEEHNFVDWFPPLFYALAVTGASTALAGAWWAIEIAIHRRSPRTPTGPPSTEEMLRLVDLSERYLASLSRAYLAGGAALFALVLVASYLAVPSLIAAARRHAVDPYYVGAPIVLMGPFVAGIATILWGAGYRRLRLERDRWRALLGGYHEATDRILRP